MSETQIAPGFLVSAPQLRDPSFEGSVILMLDHDNEEGSFGLVINRLATNIDLSTILSEMRIDVPVVVDIEDHPPVLAGGPVALERGWIIHTPDWQGPETRQISDELSVTSSMNILKDIAGGTGPKHYRFCLGYAGWGPYQLVAEIKSGAWITVPLSADLIFETTVDKIWSETLKILGIDPRLLAPVFGDA